MPLVYTVSDFAYAFLSQLFVKDGILLLEVNRLLRAGGYFAWAAQPVYKHEEAQQEAWKGILYLFFRAMYFILYCGSSS